MNEGRFVLLFYLVLASRCAWFFFLFYFFVRDEENLEGLGVVRKQTGAGVCL